MMKNKQRKNEQKKRDLFPNCLNKNRLFNKQKIINSFTIKENQNNVESYSSNFNNNEKKMYSNNKLIVFIT